MFRVFFIDPLFYPPCVHGRTEVDLSTLPFGQNHTAWYKLGKDGEDGEIRVAVTIDDLYSGESNTGVLANSKVWGFGFLALALFWAGVTGC